MFPRLRAAAGAVVILASGLQASHCEGINPAASARAATLPPASDVSPEIIDMMADAVIAKLKAKPELLLDIILSYEDKAKAGRTIIRPQDPVTGSSDGDVMVVEFFDPTCLPCRSAAALLDRVAADDGRIKVVHKDFPTTPEGIEISTNTLGGKSYAEARKAVLAGRVPERADAAGRLKAIEMLGQNREAAARVNVTAMPTLFILGAGRPERLQGETDEATLRAKIASARKVAK